MFSGICVFLALSSAFCVFSNFRPWVHQFASIFAHYLFEISFFRLKLFIVEVLCMYLEFDGEIWCSFCWVIFLVSNWWNAYCPRQKRWFSTVFDGLRLTKKGKLFDWVRTPSNKKHQIILINKSRRQSGLKSNTIE